MLFNKNDIKMQRLYNSAFFTDIDEVGMIFHICSMKLYFEDYRTPMPI